MIYICCVGIASLDVVYDNLMIVPGMVVYSRFLISVCMFIVSKALLILSVTVIVCAGGAILLANFHMCSIIWVLRVVPTCS